MTSSFKTKRRRLQVLVGLIALNGVLLFLNWPDQPGSTAFHAAAIRLLELESRRNQQVMAIYLGLVRSYDELNQLGSESRKLREELRGAAEGCRGASRRAMLGGVVQQIAKASEARAELVDHFASENATYANSRRFFPVIVLGIQDALHRAGDRQSADRLGSIADKIKNFVLTQSEFDQVEFIREFDALSASIRDPKLLEDLRNARAHAVVMVTSRPAIERLIAEMLKFHADSPIARGLARLDAVDSSEANLQTGLGLSLLVLVLILISRVVALYRNTKQLTESLSTINASLEQKVVERTSELAASEARLRMILETALDAVVSMDSKGQITLWSRQAVGMLGFSSERAIGERFLDLIRPDGGAGPGFEELSQLLSDPTRIHGGKHLSITASCFDETQVPIDLSLSVVGQGDKLEVHAFLRDVSQQKAYEQALLEARDSAETANRAKSEFLATMSHEIRTPMNAILGFTGLLQETALSEEQRDFVTTVQGSGEALLSLINDILDFSKIEAGKMALESVRFNLRDSMFTVMELLSAKAADQHVDLALDFHPDAPEWIHGDPSRVQQIAMNLVGNALKFTRQGHVLVDVTFRPASQESPAGVRILIQDTGIGIASAKQVGLFRKFSQADSSTTRRFGGTGLGLAISKQLAELMGGDIGFRSTESVGSSFWLDLPVSEADLNSHRISEPPDLDRARILVVAAGINQEVLRVQFERWHVAADYVTCLQAVTNSQIHELPLRHSAWDIVLLDRACIGLDLAFLRTAIAGAPALANASIVLLVTAAERRQAKESFEEGCAGFLVKPIVRQALLEKMLLQLWQRRNGLASNVPLGQEAMLHHGFRAGSLYEGNVLALTKPTSFGSRRVLVVEDNRNNQRLISRLLEKLSCHVEIAENGAVGVEKYSAHDYDLILMDCHMPQMSGFAATAAIRKAEESADASSTARGRRRPIPIVAITASVLPEEREQCLRSGMNDCLTKPVKFTELREAVEKWTTPPAAQAA